MPAPSLSEGALLTICKGGTVEKPVIQVRKMKMCYLAEAKAC